MNIRLWREIIGLILAALLLTSIILLAGTTAAAQGRHQRRGYQQRVVSIRSIDRSIDQFGSIREAQPIRPFHTFGPFGRSYHPFFDPYGRYDSYTFYRHSIGRQRY